MFTKQEKAYIEGFVKKAAAHGFNYAQAIGLLKSSQITGGLQTLTPANPGIPGSTTSPAVSRTNIQGNFNPNYRRDSLIQQGRAVDTSMPNWQQQYDQIKQKNNVGPEYVFLNNNNPKKTPSVGTTAAVLG
jgi:hypothetical protein